MLKQKLYKKDGFTLLELVVAMVIVSILSVVTFTGVGVIFQGLQLASHSINLMTDINIFTAQFERDVRDISINNASSQYVPRINNFTQNSFSFINNTGNTVTYSISGNQILRNGSSILNNNIDPAQTRFSFLGYQAGAEVDAITNGLAASQVRVATIDFVVVTAQQNYRIVQTYALNYR